VSGYLLNTVTVHAFGSVRVIEAGTLLTSPSVLTAVLAAGGQIGSATDPFIIAAAANVLKQRMRGQSSLLLTSLMLAAAAESAQTTPVPVGMPTGAVLALDASILASITRGVYGTVGTNEGQITTSWASQATGAATQATEANTPLYDEYALAGKPCIVYGGNADDFTPSSSTTGYVLPSLAYGVPFTVIMSGRVQTPGTIAELSTNVASASGVLLGASSSKGAATAVTVHNASLQTAVVTPVGQAFTPAMTSALFCQLESDKGITLTTGRVTRWADQSGNGHDFTDATGIAYVANGGSNNLPYLSCTGVTGSGGLACSSFALAPPYEMYIVLAPGGVITSNAWAMDFNAGTVNTIYQLSFGKQLAVGYPNGPTFNQVSGNPGTPGTTHVLCVRSPASGNITATLDGAITMKGAGGPVTLTSATIGQQNGAAAHFWNGPIYAVYFFTRLLTAAEEAILMSPYGANPGGYISSKYTPFGYGAFDDDANHTWIWSSDGTDAGLTLERDGVSIPLTTNATAPGTGAITTVGTAGSSHSLGSPIIGAVGRLYAYTSQLSIAQKSAVYTDCQSKWPLAPTSGAQVWNTLVFGDSFLSIATGVSNNFSRMVIGRLLAYRGNFVFGTPTMGAISGTFLVQNASNINGQIAGSTAFSSALPNLVIVNGGVNDINGSRTAVQIIADWGTVAASIAAKCATAGGVNHVVIQTITYNDPTKEAVRLAANIGIRAALAGYSTANAIFHLCDMGGDAMLGSKGTTVQTPYFWTDGLHPSALGYERWYGLLAQTLAAAGI
jgi:lysophospholipase L1-like esterase